MGRNFEFPNVLQDADRLVLSVRQTIRHFQSEKSRLEEASRDALQSFVTQTSSLLRLDRANCAFASLSAPVFHSNKFAILSIGKLFNRGKKKPSNVIEPSSKALTTMEALEALSPEERAKLDNMIVWNLLHKKDYEHNGKKITGKEMIETIEEELLKLQRSANIDTYEELSKRFEYTDLLERLPEEWSRRDAPKQQLRRKNQRRLELTRIAAGVCDKGFFGGKQYSFGIFAKEPQLARHMLKWASVDPKRAARSGDFFRDLMAASREMELTLMVVPYKPLSIRKLQWEYEQRMKDTIKGLFGVTREWPALTEFISMFDVEDLEGSEWVKGTKVIQDTQLFFSTLPAGNLFVEAINPGPLKDQKTTIIGATEDPFLTTALFSLFLGKEPIDREAKEQFASMVTYLAKGNTSDPPNINWKKFDESLLIDPNTIPLEERFTLHKGSTIEAEEQDTNTT